MSVDFKASKGIFQQIADNLCLQILEGKLKEGERVPSVRDLSATFEVNRNTVLRTYAILNEAGIFENKRGVGFFVSDRATERICNSEKTVFFKNDFPEFIQKVKTLKLNSTDLKDLLTVIKENDTL